MCYETWFFLPTKNLLPNEEIVLTPIVQSEIDYQVLLCYSEIETNKIRHHKLNDIYFIIFGEKGSTKKIYLNNYETVPQKEFNNKCEACFEFKSDDVGNILKINVSLNEDNNNPDNCIL